MAKTAAEMREIDRRAIRETGVAGVVLMENAGRSLAETVMGLMAIPGTQSASLDDSGLPVASPCPSPVVILCGTGNNGGDGYVAARHLLIHEVPVAVFATADPREGSDAAANRTILERLDVGVSTIDPASGDLADAVAAAPVVVDCLLGTGLAGPVRSPYLETIELVNARAGTVIAADIPSGLNSDTGEVMGAAVRAHLTVTFAAPKAGLSAGEGPALCGEVIVAHIGVPVE